MAQRLGAWHNTEWHGPAVVWAQHGTTAAQHGTLDTVAWDHWRGGGGDTAPHGTVAARRPKLG